jgi:hypothetical protein
MSIRFRLVAIAALAVLASSCGSSKTTSALSTVTVPAESVSSSESEAVVDPAPASAGGQCAPTYSPQLCMDVNITGRSALSGSTKALALGGGIADTCEQFAKGFEGGLKLPVLFDPINRVDFAMRVGIKPFTGPGSYSEEVLYGEGTPFSVSIGNDTYDRGAGTATYTIAADGSGSFVFDEFESGADTAPREPALSGKLTWVCVNPA